MNTAVTQMSVDEPIQAVVVEQSSEFAQVLAEIFRGNGGVLPSWPGGCTRGRAAAEASAVFANAPQSAGILTCHDRGGLRFRNANEFIGGGNGVPLSLATGLGEQPADPRRQLGHRGRSVSAQQHIDQAGIHPFQGKWFER